MLGNRAANQIVSLKVIRWGLCAMFLSSCSDSAFLLSEDSLTYYVGGKIHFSEKQEGPTPWSMAIASDFVLCLTSKGELMQASFASSEVSLSPLPALDGKSCSQVVFAGPRGAALTADGQLWSFIPDIPATHSIPYPQLKELPRIFSIACGKTFTLAEAEGGCLYAFGSNSCGQLGIPDIKRCEEPALVPLPGKFPKGPFRALAAGDFFSVIVDCQGGVWTCGTNSLGQLGREGDEKRFEKVELKCGAVSVATGRYHVVIQDENNEVWVWGRNESGQLGFDHKNNCRTPQKFPDFADIIHVGAGAEFSMMATSEGALYIFGRNPTPEKTSPQGLSSIIINRMNARAKSARSAH